MTISSSKNRLLIAAKKFQWNVTRLTTITINESFPIASSKSHIDGKRNQFKNCLCFFVSHLKVAASEILKRLLFVLGNTVHFQVIQLILLFAYGEFHIWENAARD